jgi:hypothetical protein
MLIRVGRRRTHQSGPLGELFDHGVDALNTSLEVLIFAASQNLGMGWKTVMTLFGGRCTFYLNRILLTFCSSPYLLCTNLGWIPYENPYTWHSLWTCWRDCDSDSRICFHGYKRRC